MTSATYPQSVRAEGIEKAFGKRKVLRNISFEVRPGEVVGLLGPNGAGKTTSFYMVCGLAMPDRGRILLDGHDITALPMHQRGRLGIGYLPQEASRFSRSDSGAEYSGHSGVLRTEPRPACGQTRPAIRRLPDRASR